MARNVAVAIENNFVSGLITEATALNFPENAVTSTTNCIFNERGIVSRRKGFDYEDSYVTKAMTLGEKAMSSFVWRSVAGDGDIMVVVQQVGADIYFYNADADGALSPGYFYTFSLNSYLASGAISTETEECQYDSGNGYLFVTHPSIDPLYVKYDKTTSTISSINRITIKIRDFEGVEDGLDVTTRPLTLETLHQYNLKNQGWPDLRIAQYNSGYTSGTDTFVGTSSYPSNAEVWWVMKNADENFDPQLNVKISRGNSPAPKGSYILNAFYQDRSNVSGLSGLSVVSSGGRRPRSVAFFAGRTFYAGVDADGFQGTIYFSQIIEKPEQFGLCHQVNDPTSEISFDLLPSDGGTIKILDAGSIIQIMSIEGSLLVFASNGIWSISGSTGVGFTANDYSVRKISNIEATAASAFVEFNGFPVFWAADGIYAVSVNPSLGQISVNSLTDGKIKTAYQALPEASKVRAKGYFDPFSRTMQWVYRSTDPTTVAERYEYDRILIFNALTGAFYTWSIDITNVKIHGVVAIRGAGTTTSTENVVDSGGNVVTDASSANVTVVISEASSLPSVLKYFVSYNGNTTFAEASSATYLDWATPLGTGVNYESNFTTGYAVRGEIEKKFQANYVTIVMDTELQGVCYFQGVWDYATSGNTGRYSSRQRIASANTSYRYQDKRVKIRGHGKALQFKVTSQQGEPFFIVGWATHVTGNANL